MTEDSNLKMTGVSAVVYEDDNGTKRRRYWDGDELVDEEVAR